MSGDLRAQMRLLKQKTDGAGLSGKDKARLLKSMREKEKQSVPVAQVPLYGSETGQKPVKKVTIPTTQVKEAPSPAMPYTSAAIATSNEPSSATQHQIAPVKYFDYSDDDDDEEPVVSSSATHINTAATLTAPSSKAPSSSQELPTSSSSLPTGFFDDVSADYSARGLNLQNETVKKQQAEQELVSSFLSTLEEETEVNELIDAAEEADEEANDALNDAIQLAYQAKTATLLSQTEHLLDRKRHRSTDAPATKENSLSDEVMHDISEVLEFAGAGNSTNVYDTVAAAVAEQKLKKRRKQEMKHSTIDELDWMARDMF